MSVFRERKDELEKHEFMMGSKRGRLAVSLDLLTDALVLIGQHTVYCRSQRHPAELTPDMRRVNKALAQAKELIQSVMEAERQEAERKTSP